MSSTLVPVASIAGLLLSASMVVLPPAPTVEPPHDATALAAALDARNQPDGWEQSLAQQLRTLGVANWAQIVKNAVQFQFRG